MMRSRDASHYAPLSDIAAGDHSEQKFGFDRKISPGFTLATLPASAEEGERALSATRMTATGA